MPPRFMDIPEENRKSAMIEYLIEQTRFLTSSPPQQNNPDNEASKRLHAIEEKLDSIVADFQALKEYFEHEAQSKLSVGTGMTTAGS